MIPRPPAQSWGPGVFQARPSKGSRPTSERSAAPAWWRSRGPHQSKNPQQGLHQGTAQLQLPCLPTRHLRTIKRQSWVIAQLQTKLDMQKKEMTQLHSTLFHLVELWHQNAVVSAQSQGRVPAGQSKLTSVVDKLTEAGPPIPCNPPSCSSGTAQTPLLFPTSPPNPSPPATPTPASSPLFPARWLPPLPSNQSINHKVNTSIPRFPGPPVTYFVI